jgi:hypothetical protein
MAFQTKYLKISKMITEQDEHIELNEVIENLIDILKLKSQMTKGWVLQLDYREDNPAYNKPVGNRTGKRNTIIFDGGLA